MREEKQFEKEKHEEVGEGDKIGVWWEEEEERGDELLLLIMVLLIYEKKEIFKYRNLCERWHRKERDENKKKEKNWSK